MEINMHNESSSIFYVMCISLEEKEWSLQKDVDQITFVENRMKGVMKPSSFVINA